MSSTVIDLNAVSVAVHAFASERDWEQYHNPKNLAMALAGEAGELLEIFQWLTPEESTSVANSRQEQSRVAQELADILIHAIRIADVLGIDLADAIEEKMESNAARYPVEEVKGQALKRD